jgi:hypothetical protein
VSGRDIYLPDVIAGLLVLFVGMAIIGGLVYVDLTTTVTRTEYETYIHQCSALSGESRVVDAGLGMKPVGLNETHVRACENTTFAEYKQGRLRSMRSAPLNAAQWGWIGGMGVVFATIGGILLRRQVTTFD